MNTSRIICVDCALLERCDKHPEFLRVSNFERAMEPGREVWHCIQYYVQINEVAFKEDGPASILVNIISKDHFYLGTRDHITWRELTYFEGRYSVGGEIVIDPATLELCEMLANKIKPTGLSDPFFCENEPIFKRI